MTCHNIAITDVASMLYAMSSSDEFPRKGSHSHFSFSLFIRFYRYFLRSGPWAWWAKLAYQVMLTIRGRLITPFVLGSMSVGLNILIRYSFMDL